MGLKTQRQRLRREAPALGGLRFALKFATLDIAGQSTPALERTWREVVSAVGQPGRGEWRFGTPKGPASTRLKAGWDADRKGQLLDAQDGVRTLFDEWLGSAHGTRFVRTVALSTTGAPGVQVRPGTIALSGSLRTMFLWELALALRDHGRAVRVCPACQRRFVKVTRKEYCSTRCQSRIYMRQRRADERMDQQKGTRHGKTRKR